MINALGDKSGRIEGHRSRVEPHAAAARPHGGRGPRAEASPTAAAELVAQGPPVDSAKVQMIRAAIAEGRYPVDPHKIAERMLALGFAP